ncbi:WhiB family transcriptional regulator [Gordonia paraffinivorans]|uniref:WhiB family transcriptional regulator n=1 Tax=Gordonia paraffinivorans TaxID=175628 RepID=UPI003FCDC31A
MFDEARDDEDIDNVRYRHHAAARICSTCPALDRCRAWAETQPHLAGSVIAGRKPRLRGAQPQPERKNQG